MAKQIQIYINSDDTFDEDIIEINVPDTCQITSKLTDVIHENLSAVVDLVFEQWKSECATVLGAATIHTEKPQAPFGREVIHDNKY